MFHKLAYQQIWYQCSFTAKWTLEVTTLLLKRLSSILELFCWEELNIYRIIVERKIIILTFTCRHLVFEVLFYERKDCPLKGDKETKINSLSSYKCLDTLKNTFLERSTQCTSFSSRKQPPNAGSEHKQFTGNPSVALQRTIWRMRIQNALLFVRRCILWDNLALAATWWCCWCACSQWSTSQLIDFVTRS